MMIFEYVVLAFMCHVLLIANTDQVVTCNQLLISVKCRYIDLILPAVFGFTFTWVCLHITGWIHHGFS